MNQSEDASYDQNEAIKHICICEFVIILAVNVSWLESTINRTQT